MISERPLILCLRRRRTKPSVWSVWELVHNIVLESRRIARTPIEPLEWHPFLLVPIIPLVPMDHRNCPVPSQVTWENNLSPLNEMHLQQQNHWNDILFYWYQSYHWYQWTIGLTNRICLCILDMCVYWWINTGWNTHMSWELFVLSAIYTKQVRFYSK